MWIRPKKPSECSIHSVDAVMIGRGTVGRPYIFKEIRHFLDTGELMKPFTVKEKVEMAKLHMKRSLAWKAAPRGIFEMRRHFITYFKALPNFKDIRIRLVTTLDVDEIFSILDEIDTKYGDIILPVTTAYSADIQTFSD